MRRRLIRRGILGIIVIASILLTGIIISPDMPLAQHNSLNARQGNSSLNSLGGCQKPSPVTPGTSANELMHSGGLLRSYRVHVPRGYQPQQPIPLVLNFHGHGSFDYVQERGTHFSTLADREDFLVVYPQGIVGPDKNTGWDDGRHKNPKSNDVLFVSDLISTLQHQWCIDADRIYATGFSNGGSMTILLACRMAARIAAFASVSGAYPPFPGGCHPSRPVPILEFHGTADKIVPYDGTSLLPTIPDWLASWTAIDGCHSQPSIFYQSGNITGERWTGCRDDMLIEHYRIDGGKHHWPTQQHDGLDATAVIWSFFQNYALPTEGIDF